MKIALFSDLHFEFYGNSHEWFFDLVADGPPVDVAVFAGDILTVKEGARDFLEDACTQFKRVLYVAGNHEYYGSDFVETQKVLRSLSIQRFNWLERDVVEIDGYKFVGATLWYPGNDQYRAMMNDYHFIKHPKTSFDQFLPAYHQASKEFLEREATEKSIVITHMLPSKKCVDKMYEGDWSNCFYVAECDHIIEKNKPALWLHGHSHQSFDGMVDNTRVVRNPYGYNRCENPEFNPKIVIEV